MKSKFSWYMAEATSWWFEEYTAKYGACVLMSVVYAGHP